MATEPNQDFSFWDGVLLVVKFVSKNLLGILSILFGTVTKVYLIRKDWKRVSKWQCRFSVIISVLAGLIAYHLVEEMDLRSWQKGLIISCTPVYIEPVIIRILIWINPIIDSIGKALEKLISKKAKD